MSVLDTYQYDDGCESCGNDSFSREPAVVKFSSPSTSECTRPGRTGLALHPTAPLVLH